MPGGARAQGTQASSVCEPATGPTKLQHEPKSPLEQQKMLKLSETVRIVQTSQLPNENKSVSKSEEEEQGERGGRREDGRVECSKLCAMGRKGREGKGREGKGRGGEGRGGEGRGGKGREGKGREGKGREGEEGGRGEGRKGGEQGRKGGEQGREGRGEGEGGEEGGEERGAAEQGSRL